MSRRGHFLGNDLFLALLDPLVYLVFGNKETGSTQSDENLPGIALLEYSPAFTPWPSGVTNNNRALPSECARRRV
jgi:hypothetical protein